MKSLPLIIILVASQVCCFAQTDTSAVATDSTIAKSTLTVGLVYTNNASYYGQKAAEKNPYLAFAATYKFKSGFYFSGFTYKLLNEKSSTISVSNLGAGFSGKLGKRWTADISYNHSFYPAYSPLLQAGNPDNASVGLTYENFLSFNITGDYAFGKSNDAFVTAGMSKSINLFSIGQKDIVTFTPSADIVGGTQRYYQTYVTQQKLRDSVLGNILSPITGSPSGGSTTKTVSSTAFNVLSYNFKLPVAYNRAHYVLEANYQLSVLSNKVEADAGKTNSFVTVSFYYQF